MSEEKTPYQLPKGWIWTTIGELGVVTSGGTPSTKNPQFWEGDVAWITPADLSSYKEKYISSGRRNISKLGLDYSSATLLPKNTLLFSSRAPIGYVVIAQNELATNQGFKNLIPMESTYVDYLYYYLIASKQLAEGLASGTTFLELSANKFSRIPVPFPPRSTQELIVAKIEELFSELDKSLESLEKAKKQLEIYRHVLLKNAFEGKLTEKWRNEYVTESSQLVYKRIKAARKNRYDFELKEWQIALKKWKEGGVLKDKPTKPKDIIEGNPSLVEKNKLSKIPKEWLWVKNKFVAYKITDGEHITPKRAENGYYLLSARNIQNGYLDLRNVDYVGQEEYDRIRKRCNPEFGDILISCSGSIGRVSHAPLNSDFVMVRSVALMKYQFKDLNYKFLEYQFQSPELQFQIGKRQKATAQANLFLGPIGELELLLCSKEEQDLIVDILETQFSICENTEQTILDSIGKIKMLRQSILKQAFEGLLTESNNTESASELLEIIRQEKETFRQEEQTRPRVKRIKMEQELKGILEILQENNTPMQTKKLWEVSIHKENIDAFYDELKMLIEARQIKELPRKGKESFIALTT